MIHDPNSRTNRSAPPAKLVPPDFTFNDPAQEQGDHGEDMKSCA